MIQAASSEDWTGAILGGYYTGLRLRDIADLRWSAVDLEGRIIKVTTRKTGKSVTVPIHPQFA
ncbi:MAG: tyrosine-type recombinase/integrase, partial [Chthoniobacterales bacterium]